MNPDLIFWPMIILALYTLGLYVPMSRARVSAVKSGKVKASAFKLNEGEPEESRRINNAIANQYQVPILFYAVCLAAYVSGNAGSLMIVLAWAFTLAKIAHSLIHVTTNKLRHRRPMFMLAYFILILMWLAFAGHLLKMF